MIDWRWLQALPGLFAHGPMNAFLFYPRFMRVTEQKLGPDLHALLGGGSNVTALISGGEALLIDAKFPPQDARVEAFLQRCGARVGTLVNTHHHYDHTHGNVRFGGAAVLAHRRAVERLDQVDRRYWRDPGASAAKPHPLAEAQTRIEFGGETVELIYAGPGHTDGDLIVRFADRGVVCTGDLMFHGHYPFVDHTAGGSFRSWLAALDTVLKLDGDIIVPGHGPIATMRDVARFRSYIGELTESVEEAWRAGATPEEMERTIQLSSFSDLRPVPSFSLVPDLDHRRIEWASRKRNIRWAWSELVRDPP